MEQTLTCFKSRVGYFSGLIGLTLLLQFLPSLMQAQVSCSVTSINVTCYGLNNGKASAFGSGGWAPYTYQWSNGLTTQHVAGLAPGTYYVTVTDMDLGYAVCSVTITQPPQLGVTVAGSTQICGVAPDGTATATPWGGIPPYTYLWSNGGTSAQITGLPGGIYTVTLTDATGCTAVGSDTVHFWNEGLWLMTVGVDVTCYGLNNGMAEVTPMSGTPPYTYLWSNGGTTKKINNLAPGTYTVTVTDANGCVNELSFLNQAQAIINQPPQLIANITTTPATCGLNGSASVSISGGTGAYSVLWSTGSTNFTINVPPGTYSVTVTDEKNCTATDTEIVIQLNNGPSVSVTALTTAGCIVGGSAQATASGGSGNYAYFWDNGQNTATATNLTAGVHTVTVTDITTGCTATANVTIQSAPTLQATATLLTNATCLIGGSAQATASGGTPPYAYLWDNGQTTATATNLIAGTHTVTVTDAAGCIKTANVNIGQSQGPTVTAVVNTNATCTSGGSATATATGGAGGYIYLWDNGQTTATATNLSVGPHKVTVTDAAGCSAMASVTITQPSAPSVSVSVTQAAGCVVGATVSASASGGTPGYNYLWNNGLTLSTLLNLTPGVYTVTVTDAAGCTATGSVAVVAPLPPNVVITASTNSLCDQPGSATASASGGGQGYSYLWDNGETTMTAVNLAPGTHTVTVTDAAGCTATATVSIGFSENGIIIGDYVWYDNDQDGFQDPQETSGVPNITVMLIKAGPDGQFGTSDDVTVESTTTNSSGYYQFECVTPGTYIIMFSGIPAGYEFTGKDKVPNDCKDSDANHNGKTAPFTIVAGQGDNLCFDAGIHIICENVTYAGTICCNQTICEGETPAALVPGVPPSGGSGALQYVWMQLVQVGQAPPEWMGIPGANGPSYQPGPLFQTSYFMRCVRREGCVTFLESNIVTITVLPEGSPGCGSFLTDFVVIPTGAFSVSINWTAAPEFVQYQYELEHSTDQLVWNTLTVVNGKHNTIEPNSYHFVHAQPENGRNFYRVKRSSSTSEVISEIRELNLEVSFAEAVAIYPNPVTSTLNIRNFMRFTSDVTIDLLNTNGRNMLGGSIVIASDAVEHIELPMDGMPSGVYMARIRFGNGEVRTIKLTKF